MSSASSSEVAEGDIRQVMEILGLDGEDDISMVINALKSNSHDVHGVIAQWFDGQQNFRQKYKSGWDETMFTADRDGTQNQTGISFHIESPSQNDVIQSVTPPPDYAVGAPSRPPSRTNSRSPLGRVADWTAGLSDMPSSQTQEDEDMKRAIRESAQEAGIEFPQQESGVLNAPSSNPHFGPANRTDYEQGEWAMVPRTSAEAPPDDGIPAPSERKRAEGTPAFLVQGRSTTGQHSLGGLLTILHEIPLARNVLLECGDPAASYGHNSAWWNGSMILPPHILSKLQEGQLDLAESEEAKPSFKEEVHRLMGFLDSTERSYGTVSVLADVLPSADNGPDNTFYEILNDLYPDNASPMVQTLKIALVQGDDLGDEEGRFGFLDIRHTKETYTRIKTLYECLDHIMWSDMITCEPHERSKMAMFEEMGEVLVLKLGGEGPDNGIEIPMEFYPERYLTTRKDEARRIQLAMRRNMELLMKASGIGQNVRRWQEPSNNKEYDKKDLISRERKEWQAYKEYLQGRASYRSLVHSGYDLVKYPDYRHAPCQMDNKEQELHGTVEEVIQWTDRVLADLDQKAKDLETELGQIEAKQRFLGRLLTEPNKPGRPKPMMCKQYLLRGVACSGNVGEVIYVCQRREQDLIELDDQPKALDQWWKLSFWGSRAEQPVEAVKVEYERVLREMWSETKNPLLIYATEDALNVPRKELTPALDRFVRADNKAFRNELNQQKVQASESKKAVLVDPLSPSKRKHRDSIDSMDSNRVSVGSDNLNGFDDPFADQDQGMATELMDMTAPASAENGDHAYQAAPPDYESRSADTAAAGERADSDASDLAKPPLPERRPRSVSPAPNEPLERSVKANSDVFMARSPEMQERARAPAFITRPDGAESSKGNYGGLDMDIPDHHD